MIPQKWGQLLWEARKLSSKLLLVVEVVPHDSQRYPICGDWTLCSDGSIHVKVSDVGDRVSELLVGLHEAVEAILCREHGVSEESVCEFDIAFEKDASKTDDDEPGEDPAAPYHREHAIAEVVERLVAAEAGVKWCEYDARIDGLFDKEVAP